jgi:hypothetical protein
MNLQIIGAIKAATNAEVTSTTDADGLTTYHITKDGKTADVKVSAASHAAKSAEFIAQHVKNAAHKQFEPAKG